MQSDLDTLLPRLKSALSKDKYTQLASLFTKLKQKVTQCKSITGNLIKYLNAKVKNLPTNSLD